MLVIQLPMLAKRVPEGHTIINLSIYQFMYNYCPIYTLKVNGESNYECIKRWINSKLFQTSQTINC